MSIVTEEVIVKKCNFDKLCEYIRSDKIPTLYDNESAILVSKEENGTVIKKIINKKIPVSSLTSMLIGFSRADFYYKITFTQNTITVETSNAECLDGYFKYSECIKFVRNDPKFENDTEVKTITVIRKSVTEKQKVGQSILNSFYGNPEKMYHLYAREYIELIIEESNL